MNKEIRDEIWDDIIQALANYRLMHKAKGDEIGAQLVTQHIVAAKTLKQYYDIMENSYVPMTDYEREQYGIEKYQENAIITHAGLEIKHG